jgi:N-methylhydantoinase A
MSWRLGVDVGGTFTDLVAVDEQTGRREVIKVLTTPDDQAAGVLEAITTLLARSGASASDVGFLAHGTTVATNGFLERDGARTALVTTRGFRDVLEFRRGDRAGVMDPYDFNLDFPQPLVPRALRFEADERLDFSGTVIEPLDEAAARDLAEAIKAAGAEAVAVSLLFAYANPEHERAVARILGAVLGESYITCSSDVDPQAMEYERTSTTVVNAYLGPVVARYLRSLDRRVAEAGLPPVHVMQSSGGLVRTSTAVDLPVALLESGPAGGMVAAARLVASSTATDAIVVDMGGTSFDVGLVIDRVPQRLTATEIDGHAIRFPMLDIRSIGAGGGSIAHVDRGGTLRVGPRSAGSRPGPACYGRGGTLCTTTDADLLLGYFAGDSLLGGSMPLDREAAARAVDEHVATPLGLSRVEAAAGVVRIIDANMADAIRVMVTYRGLDPRSFTIVAGGGAGPLHAARVARELGIARVLVPLHPGTLSAVGLTQTDIVHDRVTTALLPLPGADPAAVEASFATMEDTLLGIFERDGVDRRTVEITRELELRYFGQQHDLSISAPLPFDAGSVDAVLADFHARHHAVYGFSDPSELVMAVALHTTGRSPVATVADAPVQFGGDAAPATGEQQAYFWEADGWMATTVVERSALPQGHTLIGPALIRQEDSSTLVLPGQHATVLASGALLLEDR